MPFQVPDTPAPQVPAALVPLIDQSVVTFEKQLRDALGMWAHAVDIGKWLADYRVEVTRVAIGAWNAAIDEHDPVGHYL
jgi:hypothetical protein